MRFVVSLLLGVCGFLLSGQAGFGQSIVGQDETIVVLTGNDFAISNGVVAGNNLFHSFVQFGLLKEQTANFKLPNSPINQIFARVTGGTPSFLNGTVTIDGGGSPSFYLMNPAGVIFGPNFQFPTGLPLTATTANGMLFDSQWWSATGVNDYMALAKEPVAFGFTTTTPAAIVNRWTSGDSPLTLIAGTIISPADAMMTVGNITIAAVPGNRLVRITSAESLLGLEIRPFVAGESVPHGMANAVPSLAQLITGPGPDGGTIGDATGLRMNPDGTVFLSGASLSPGDIYTGNLMAGGIVIGAPIGNVTVATLESRDQGIQINAGENFQAVGSRQYENVQLNPGSLSATPVAASIVLRKQNSLPDPAGSLSIVYGNGTSLTADSQGLRLVGTQPFVVGSSMGFSPIPLNTSGTASAILRSEEGRAAGLVVSYANQTFGQNLVRVDVKPGGVGVLPVAFGNQTVNQSANNPNANLTVTMSDQGLRSSPQSKPANQSCRAIAAPKRSKILAVRSGAAIAPDGCATDRDDDAILKILE
jgi:filamentous hemagglutinin family protein